MQYTLLTAALGLTVFSSASVISNTPRGSPSILSLPLSAAKRADFSKRYDNALLPNSEHGTRYLIHVSIGTPKQQVVLDLDTGSSTTWVNPDCSTAGTRLNIEQCQGTPQFLWKDSSSLKDEGIRMNQTYGIGWAQGWFVNDNMYIGDDLVVSNQEFGIATESSLQPVGVLGVSPAIGGTGNPTFIDNLASQGLTKSRAFSIDIFDVDGNDGTIVFGGIDTKKYEGSLEKLPIIPPTESPDGADRYWVYMSSVGITKPGQAPKKYAPTSTNPKGQAVFLDTGSTLSNVPTSLFNAILADFPGATLDPAAGTYQVDCKYASEHGTVDFGFGNKVIHVPFKEFLWQPAPGYCYLGVRTAPDNSFLLGDTFLRAAYVVYDQDNRNLHVAKAAYCGEHLWEIGTGPDAVPSRTGECLLPVATTTTSTTRSSSKTATTSSSSATTATSPSVSATITPGPTATSSDVESRTATSSDKYPGSSSSNGKSTYPVPSYPAESYSAGYPISNSTASGPVSTVYSTTIYTISSCPPAFTSCPYGHVTTETNSYYTTPYPTTDIPISTGSGYPIQPIATTAPAPPITNNAGKAAINLAGVAIAAFAAVFMFNDYLRGRPW